MHSLVQQLTQASRYAQREADRIATEARIKAERQKETRAKQWASRKAGGNGVAEELLKRLPTTKEGALSLPAIEAMMKASGIQQTGISSALSVLVNKHKAVARIGEKRAYRYYVPMGVKP